MRSDNELNSEILDDEFHRRPDRSRDGVSIHWAARLVLGINLVLKYIFLPLFFFSFPLYLAFWWFFFLIGALVLTGFALSLLIFASRRGRLRGLAPIDRNLLSSPLVNLFLYGILMLLLWLSY